MQISWKSHSAFSHFSGPANRAVVAALHANNFLRVIELLPAQHFKIELRRASLCSILRPASVGYSAQLAAALRFLHDKDD